MPKRAEVLRAIKAHPPRALHDGLDDNGRQFIAMGFHQGSQFDDIGIACFALSVGPVTWVILSEVFPTRIRGLAMSIATVCLWVANFVVSQTFPMLDGNDWLVQRFHHAFPFWLYGAFSLLAVLFLVFCVPETKGKSLEEIERHWLGR